MFRSYLLISFRSIWKKKGVAIINLLCLALGMATALFIFNYARHEFSFDQYHDRSESIYRLETDTYFRQEVRKTDALTTFKIAPQLIAEQDQLGSFARATPFSENGSAFVYHKTAGNSDIVTFVDMAYYADNYLIDLFTLKHNSTLEEPLGAANTVIISEELASKICEDYLENIECILGKSIYTRQMGGSQEEWTITGVFQELPSNTHLKFDALFSNIQNLNFFNASNELNTYSYVKASNEFDIFNFNQSILDKEQLSLFSYLDQDFVSLRPISEIHLSPNVSNAPEESTKKSFIIFMMITGVIILLLTSTNFINSSIIRSIERSKEVGIRRLVGIHPKQLLINILLESFLFNLIAAVIGFGLFLLAFSFTSTLSDLNYPQYLSNETFRICISILGGLIVLSTIASAYYPAKMLMELRPVEALKGSSQVVHSGQSNKGSMVMRGLLIFQLTISIIFIAGMYIVQEQLTYVKENDVRTFRMNLQAKFPGLTGATDLYAEMAEMFMNESINKGRFREIWASSTYKGQITSRQRIKGLRPIGADTSIHVPDFNLFVIDYKLFMGLDNQFLEGRNFTQRFGFDYDGAIVNEAALNAMGLDITDNVIGTKIGPYNGFLKIIGIYPNESENEEPRIYVTGYRYPVYFNINVNTAGNSAEKLRAVVAGTERALHDQFGNTYVITRKYDKQFTFEAALVKLFYFFTVLAVLISALGIYALASFTAIKRTKEIGIRKILGARISQILFILSADFMKLMVVGSAISLPIVFLIARRWLDDYAYRIDLGLQLFLLPVIAMSLLSLVIVIRQCWNTSILSPLSSLRAE